MLFRYSVFHILQTPETPSYNCFLLVNHKSWLSIKRTPTINFGLSLYKNEISTSSFFRQSLLWWLCLGLLKCNHFSGIHLNAHLCTFGCIPVKRMAYVSPGIPLIWSVKVLHIMTYTVMKLIRISWLVKCTIIVACFYYNINKIFLNFIWIQGVYLPSRHSQ